MHEESPSRLGSSALSLQGPSTDPGASTEEEETLVLLRAVQRACLRGSERSTDPKPIDVHSEGR